FEKFASDKIFNPNDNPISLFMAGSPGAGKTEYSKALLKIAKNSANPIVRIDADEIREIIPQYNGANSDIVQSAASIGVHKLYDYILKNRLNAMIDGTFASFEIAHRNIKRSLSRDRSVGIYYIYQDPLVAWEFTKKREKLEGRRVPKKVFIESFFNSKINVIKIKSIFKDDVKIYLVIKNYNNNVERFYPKVNNIDSYLETMYSEEKLNQLLK
ncbi:zeta toxin family protein, partial [Candidatus Parcubacteria bacterium]|nr:zeta toxin family protein [Candidatus Parcubacteria bacterium]